MDNGVFFFHFFFLFLLLFSTWKCLCSNNSFHINWFEALRSRSCTTNFSEMCDKHWPNDSPWNPSAMHIHVRSLRHLEASGYCRVKFKGEKRVINIMLKQETHADLVWKQVLCDVTSKVMVAILENMISLYACWSCRKTPQVLTYWKWTCCHDGAQNCHRVTIQGSV